MGFEEVNSNSGYTKFGKGANLLVKPTNIDDDEGSYNGDEYYELQFVFDAVPENGGEPGRVPAWLSSKITIRESEKHTSKLGKFLRAAGVLEDVLQHLGADDALIQEIKDGDQRFEATSEDENKALLEAVAKSLDGVVLRAGSGWSSSEEYSVVNDFYERVSEDPFSDDPADHADADDASESPEDDDGAVDLA